jgi:hypothetical protein
MTSYDADPASSEPSSIGPMALDTNQWKIDLDDLHSGERFDFSIPPHLDDDEEVASPTRRPRTGRRVLGVMTAVVLVAGLGFAAFRARPFLQRATASMAAPARVGQTTTAPAAPPVVAAPVVAAPPVPAPPAVAQETPSAAAKAIKGQQAIPTFSPNALPNAPKAKRGKRGK